MDKPSPKKCDHCGGEVKVVYCIWKLEFCSPKCQDEGLKNYVWIGDELVYFKGGGVNP